MPPFQDSEVETKSKETHRSWFKILLLIAISFFTICAIFYAWIFYYLELPPSNFPTGVALTIPDGASAKTITKLLAERDYVRSDLALYLTLVLWYDPSNIKASTYIFDEPLSTRGIANEITKGHFDQDLIRLTHIEGESAVDLAKRAENILPAFSAKEFLALALPDEGKLFPETYLIPETYTATELHELLLKTFNESIKPIKSDLDNYPLPLDDIIALASIIEREANTAESMKIVSGILQTRLDIGMPLQVDASMEYILDKPLSELKAEDLDIDSPYNTYLYKGLPPTAIGNPGLDAILAVLKPTQTDYLFYITGSDGEFYYAKTFDEHKLNIARYLR